MTCGGTAEKLPAYLEGDLPPEEAHRIEAHLASCGHCRSAMEDLVKTRQLVGGLDEVDAPPWLKQRIMTRVRTERERKERRLRTWLRPLHITIPATALATVLIAGIAVYVFKAIEPETIQTRNAPVQAGRDARQAEPSRPEPARTPGKTQMRPPPPASPAAPTSRLAAPRKGGPAPTGAEPKARPLEDAGASKPLGALVPERADRAAGEAYRERSAKEEARNLDAAGPQAGARGKAFSARTMAPGPEYAIFLHTQDPAKTVDLVDGVLTRSGARRIVRAFRDNAASITAEVDAGKAKDIQEELKALGDLREQEAPPMSPGDIVVLRIEIVPKP